MEVVVIVLIPDPAPLLCLSVEPTAETVAQRRMLLPENDFLAPVRAKTVKKPVTMEMIPRVQRAQPAVPILLPGASYNPRAEDHRRALELAVQEEMNRLYQIQKLKDQLPCTDVLQLQGLDADATMNVDLESSGDEEEEEEEVDNNHDNTNEHCSVEEELLAGQVPSTSGAVKRKTKQQKKKQEKQKLLEREHEAQKKARQEAAALLGYPFARCGLIDSILSLPHSLSFPSPYPHLPPPPLCTR